MNALLIAARQYAATLEQHDTGNVTDAELEQAWQQLKFARTFRDDLPSCPHSPFGQHQVDTSMESGPSNCFYCEQPMP